ncbi:MAG TPA: HAMP domain-containing sensor histidine kinase [Gemmatimonadaceae bacterium]
MSRADTGAPDVRASALEQRLAALEAQHVEALREIAELKARDQLKTQFISNISHDLRTPLTAIITHAEILRDGILGPLNDRQAESVTGVINGGRQLLDMVGEILSYAKGSANQLTLAISDFGIADVVQRVTALNESLVARKGLTLSVEVAPDLPTVRGDREKISHVLGNLLGNAITFTPSGGRVWVAARAVEANAGGEILVEVGDTGIGIAPENHDLVFREFAQVDSSPSRRHHGTGLGLTIARRLVELHRGRLWLESTLGTGSRFYFTIPLVPSTP